MSANNQQENLDPVSDKDTSDLLTRKVFLNVLLLTIGFFLITNSYQLGEFFFPFLRYTEFLFSFIGIMMIGIPTANGVSIFLKNNTKSLSSIDTEENIKNNRIIFKKISKTIDLLDYKSSSKNLNNKEILNFKFYFNDIISKLELKSSDSEKKASLLLDNGKIYAISGIVYFIISTLIWQIYIMQVEKFETQHIYGLISTSLIFIFIEFLSAWYLRQYKSFSDTSIYLTKIKSIFDKYMLIYLVSVEKGDKDFSILLEQLSTEIKWPETYLLKNADVSFAKDALETMTTMAQTFKSEIKNKAP